MSTTHPSVSSASLRNCHLLSQGKALVSLFRTLSPHDAATILRTNHIKPVGTGVPTVRGRNAFFTARCGYYLKLHFHLAFPSGDYVASDVSSFASKTSKWRRMPTDEESPDTKQFFLFFSFSPHPPQAVPLPQRGRLYVNHFRTRSPHDAV